jgi:hypothetical protein
VGRAGGGSCGGGVTLTTLEPTPFYILRAPHHSHHGPGRHHGPPHAEAGLGHVPLWAGQSSRGPGFLLGN